MRIDGDNNLSAGRDIVFSNGPFLGLEDHLRFFRAHDDKFRKRIDEKLSILKSGKKIAFSSESLFTSLIAIGLPVSCAYGVVGGLIDVLAELLEERRSKGGRGVISTSDIRSCVLRLINSLEFWIDVDSDAVKSWATSYMRRFGSDNEYMKIIDGGDEKELTHQYLSAIVLPHVIARIIGNPSSDDPFALYDRVFSSRVVDDMSRLAMRFCNQLNLYSIRYKTLLHLLQDYMVEPPHPLMVGPDTQERIVEYNLVRARNHYDFIAGHGGIEVDALLRRSADECFMHSCAAILAHYGSYLGADGKYGYLELRRILAMQDRKGNVPLWKWCRIHEIERDLRQFGSSVRQLRAMLDRIRMFRQTPGAIDKHFIFQSAEFFYRTSMRLVAR